MVRFFKKAHLLTFLFFCISTLISAQLPEGFVRERIAMGLNPTSMVLSPDGRIFITEKNGKVRVVRDGLLLSEPLLSIEVDQTNERGLSHIVLHPDFEINHYYYIFYSVSGGRHNRVSRFTANGDKSIPGSEMILIDLDELGSDIHNGGAMLFGLDGYLYISTGEGSQNWVAEDLSSTNGKILRLDEVGQPVPDNPWFNSHIGRANTVYAYGLRNPFTMSMNPLTGDMYFNDVGGNKFEEVNKIVKGAFYGWPKVEGKASGESLPPEYLDPVYQYAHTDHYCCIVGSTFYSPSQPQFPQQYIGRYFYSDYCTGNIRMLDVSSGQDAGLFISDGDRVIDMLVDREGSVYYLERKGIGDGSQEDNTSTDHGTLWKVSYTGAGTPFISAQPESLLVSTGESAVFTVGALGAIPLSFTWFVNGEKISGYDALTYTFENTTLVQDSTTIYVEIANSLGIVTSDTVILHVTENHRPEPLILTPMEGAKYQAGNSILFSGSGMDAEDGDLPPSGFSWRIDFQHGSHSHPGMAWTSGVTNGEWQIPSAGETSSDVWYRLYLKLADSQGLTKMVYRDIFPQLGNIQVSSSPDGLYINLDGAAAQTPYFIEGVTGISRYISAPLKQVYRDSIYFFEQWSDGSKVKNKEVKASLENQSIIGKFKGVLKGKGHGLTASFYDNIGLKGTPILVKLDSVISYQCFLQPPNPLVPADNFSVEWNGYLQAYHSGMYHFGVVADDGIVIEIDHQILIDKWENGVHYETGSTYMESGHLYPIRIKWFDGLYNAQIKLRWSSDDFEEEIIPPSQLYPSDYLSKANTTSVISLQTMTSNTLEVYTESYKDLIMDFTVVSENGISFVSHAVEVPVGKNIISFDISRLAPGIYFLTGMDRITSEKMVKKFVKIN